VRGVGGLVTDGGGATSVPGLYGAGDAASRESVVGAASGGGGPNSTWAIASGLWAGARLRRAPQRSGPARIAVGRGEMTASTMTWERRSILARRAPTFPSRRRPCFPSNGTSRGTQRASVTRSSASMTPIGRFARRGAATPTRGAAGANGKSPPCSLRRVGSARAPWSDVRRAESIAGAISLCAATTRRGA
jgi:hypothetical protein